MFTRSRRRWLTAFIIVAFLVDVWVVYTFQTSHKVSEGDFFIPWYATHEMVVHGRDPYSDSVTTDIQIVLHGAPFGPEVEDRLSFNYPLYTALYLLPFIGLDYPLAEAIWNVINQFALVALVWVLLRLVGWRPTSMIYRQLPYLFGFLCYPFLYTIAYGQYTIVSLLFAASGALLFRHQRYLPGGILIGLSMFKPQIGVLLVIFLLLWCVLGWRQRWRGAVGISLVGVALLFLPMIWQADWLLRWMSQASYRRLHPGMYSFTEDTTYLSGLGRTATLLPADALAGIFGLGLLWLWWRDRQRADRFPVLFALTAFATLMIVPQWGFCNDVLFYPAAFLCMQWLRPRISQRLFTLLILGLALVSFAPVLINPVLYHALLCILCMLWLGYELRRKPPTPVSLPDAPLVAVA